MIHHTRGIYANGEFKDNGVSSENIAAHIWYNLRMRPGRGFFVDGLCLNQGYLTDAQVKDTEELLKTASIKMKKDTAPYV